MTEPDASRTYADLERRASAVSPECGPVAPIKDSPLTVGELREALLLLPDAAVVVVEMPYGDDVSIVEAAPCEGDFDTADPPYLALMAKGTREAWYREIVAYCTHGITIGDPGDERCAECGEVVD